MKKFLETFECGYASGMERLLRLIDEELPAPLAFTLVGPVLAIGLIIPLIYLAARWFLVPRKYWP